MGYFEEYLTIKGIVLLIELGTIGAIFLMLRLYLLEISEMDNEGGL